MADLEIRNLHAAIDGSEILRGIDLEMSRGQIHAIMGPNGSGKSTLANVLMGHPAYEVTDGQVIFEGTDVLELEPDERSRLGLFLAFQYPSAVPGVTVANFLRMAVNAHRRSPEGDENPIRIPEFRKLLQENMELLKIDRSMSSRYLNDGFSGGEKKRMEMLQMAMLQPRLAIMDETDSGLDIDALRIVSDGVNRLAGPELGVLVITHYSRLLQYIKPDVVHILVNGRIVRTGGPELADELEREGYAPYGVEEEAIVNG
ncbi:MAG TPA: Fe-S cluster assembly ATPase SufC [Gaiellales bacterium]|jgi:Fe-S cluster assembly ATP-binding protein|nr:Fe-S cluster assembly ATPase SufC [Gaiellales bacterium]